MYVGRLATSLNMRGFQVALLRLNNHPEWLELLDAPTSAPAWPAPYLLDKCASYNVDLENKIHNLKDDVAQVLQSMLFCLGIQININKLIISASLSKSKNASNPQHL